MTKEEQLYCVECQEKVREDDSPGVYVHDMEETDEGYELDADHVAIPDRGDEYPI